MKKSIFDIQKLFNFGDVKNFLEETGAALVAFSIFLTVLTDLFNASFADKANVYYQITIFLLYFIILFLGFFVMAYSNKYDNYFVRVFGLITFIFPIFFVPFLTKEFQNTILQGGYILIMIASIILSTAIINLLLAWIQKRLFKNKLWFAIVCGLIAAVLFTVMKYTSFPYLAAKLAIRIIPFAILPDWVQIIVLGLEIGIFTGVVLAPSLAFLRGVLPKDK